MSARQIIVQGAATGLVQEIAVGSHLLRSDEPVDLGGTDAGPTPYDLLCAALGSCTSMTLAMYARRKGWPLERVEVRIAHGRIHAADCADCETREGKLDELRRELVLVGPLSDEQRARLVEIADRCPVHRTLTSEIVIRTTLAASRTPAGRSA